MYIEKINSPDNLKALDKKELQLLATEIRSFIVENLSHSGGHLASNLGMVDLTLILHYLFDSPKDSFVFDVGHQAYTHKIITGRRDLFHTIRSFGGISGFPKRHESIHDIEETGHASTSLSFSLGLATARKQLNEEGDVIAIIGDGAMTGGLALEAINNIAHTKTNLIVVVNNNEMSIGNNIGAISKSLNMTFNDRLVQDISARIKDTIENFPLGKFANDFIKRLESAIRSFVAPGIVFRELGFKYFGPVDGHNYEELLNTFAHVKASSGARMVQVNTVKGKGYPIAEKNPAKFHGIGAFNIETGELIAPPSKTYSNVAGECILRVADENERVVAITAAMEAGTGLGQFALKYPERFFDVGIAEGHATTFAVGLAQSGLIPFVAIYSTFLQRAFDQLIHDVCIMNANVKFMIDRAGVVPEDGDTHQGIFDVAFLRIIPNMTIFAPVSDIDFSKIVDVAMSINTPVAIRYPKSNLVPVAKSIIPSNVSVGKSHIVREGIDGLIISYGVVLDTINEVLDSQSKNIALLNLVCLKPLDRDAICKLARSVSKILVIEEVVKNGSIGSAILEILCEEDILVQTKIHAIPNKFLEVGSRSKLLQIYKLDCEGIMEVVNNYFNN